MQFIGVCTAGSLSMRLFPHWARVLGVSGATLQGIDLPIGAGDKCYRAAVRGLVEDPAIRGALITSHKLGIVRAARDLIGRLTAEAQLSGEVSALYRRGGLLWGHACDPENSGRAMEHFLGADYWQRHPEAVILSLGAGGATAALLLYLLTRARWRPRRMQIVDFRADNLQHCRRVADMLCSSGMQCEYILNAEAAVNDGLVGRLPPHSLVINATGMGKDLPGSPITGAARFPECGAAWELNYRGERLFLEQARSCASEGDLAVADGWHYFMHGWSSVMSHVYDVPVGQERFAKFCEVSDAVVRGPRAECANPYGQTNRTEDP